MNKSDLIVALAAKKNLTEKQAMEIVNLIFDGFTGLLLPDCYCQGQPVNCN
jgi:nucleoid DNA-binding protein